MQKQKKISAEQTFQMMQCGGLDLNFPVQFGILLLGKTKAGKTTTSHYLSHQLLRGAYNDQKSIVYKLQNADPKFIKAKIGDQQSVSQTQIPNFFDFVDNGKKTYLIDCPGYLDTFGCYRIISNRFFHYQVFSKVQNIKFIITFPYRMMSGVASQMKQTFSEFLKGFANINQIKQEIFKSTSIVVTGVPKQFDLNAVRDRYRGTPNNVLGGVQDFYIQLKQEILNKNRLFIFKAAQLGQACDTENKLLDQINKSTQYWKRQINADQQVDMKNIKISLTQYVQKDEKSFDDQLINLKQHYIQHCKASLENLTNVLKKLVQDNQKLYTPNGQDTYEAIKQMIRLTNAKREWRKKQSKCNLLYQKYKQKRDALKKQLFKPYKLYQSQSTQIPFWLSKIKSLKTMQQLSAAVATGYSKQRQLQGLYQQSKIIRKILQTLLALTKSKKQSNSINDNKKNQAVLDFIYQVYKDIQISNKLYRLVKYTNPQKDNKQKQNNSKQKQKPNVTKLQGGFFFILVQYPSTLRSMFLRAISKSSKELMLENINKLDFNKNMAVKSSQEVARYLQQFKNQLKSNKQINHPQKQQKQGKQITQTTLSSVMTNIDNKIALLKNNVFESIKKNPNPNLSQLRKMQQNRIQMLKKIKQCKDNAQNNQTLKAQYNRCILVIADCLFKNSQLMIALQLYDTLFNAHKVFEILDLLASKLNKDIYEQNIKHLIYYMKKAKKYHRKQLAMQKAQNAYHYAQESGDIVRLRQISNFIKKLIKQNKRQNNIMNNHINQDILDDSEDKDLYYQYLYQDVTQVEISKVLSQKIIKLSDAQTPTGGSKKKM